MSVRGFGETAVRLARNPLGIFALFLVLIYGIACLTFTFAPNLPPNSILCFVAFLLTYPFVVLFVFYQLVTKHHTKLYSPRDFPRPENFTQLAYGDQERQTTRQIVMHSPSVAPELRRRKK